MSLVAGVMDKLELQNW